MKNLLIFSAGAVVGSLITWKLIEKKYKDLADEEIESVKETFKNRKEMIVNEQLTIDNDEIDKKIEDLRSRYSVDTEEHIHVEPTEEEHVVPYIIDEDNFGEFPHYGLKYLTYFKDNVLADEVMSVIDNPDIAIGPEALKLLNKDTDQLYIRDEDNEIDYELTLSDKTYKEECGEED